MDQLVARKNIEWPTRADFIERNFSCYASSNIDPVTVCFIDGSILNNRPFREAISAIGDHPAYREVDRRIVYSIRIQPRQERHFAAAAPAFSCR